MIEMTGNSDFQMVFKKLKTILVPYSQKLVIKNDDADEFYINTNFIMKNKNPMYFGSVKINKNYVSFHLMPVYVFPDLLENLSPALKKRMQGKSCFNFNAINETLFEELSELTERGFKQYENSGYL